MTPDLTERYRTVIAAAPGPAPWYLHLPASDLSTPERAITWRRDQNGGASELIGTEGRIYALASIYTYIQRISPSQFVVWYPSGARQTPLMNFELYDLASLRPLTEEQARRGRLTKAPFAAGVDPVAQHSMQQRQQIGFVATHYPDAFAAVPELLVLAHSDYPEPDLWILNPSSQQMSVARQAWFATNDRDFGYEWITRVTRDPDTHNLFGDGIRISPFMLNDDGSEFRGWIQI